MDTDGNACILTSRHSPLRKLLRGADQDERFRPILPRISGRASRPGVLPTAGSSRSRRRLNSAGRGAHRRPVPSGLPLAGRPGLHLAPDIRSRVATPSRRASRRNRPAPPRTDFICPPAGGRPAKSGASGSTASRRSSSSRPRTVTAPVSSAFHRHPTPATQ